MKRKTFGFAIAALLCLCAGAAIAGVPILSPEAFTGLTLIAGIGSIEDVNKQLDGIESSLKAFSEKAEAELKAAGQMAADTKAAIEGLGLKQCEFADRLLQIEQKGTQRNDTDTKSESWGSQFVKSTEYLGKQGAIVGRQQFHGVASEVKNTVIGSDAVVAPDRKPGVVGGAFQSLRLEDILTSVPTSSNAIEYTRENVFTNAAAEAAEGAALVESSITFALDNVPVQSVGHWIKISRQLAADNAALAAYINTRMKYGVDLRVEMQLYAGNGTSPSLSGLAKAGNFTAHGYTNASLTALSLSPTNRFDLIGKVLGDSAIAGFPADAILLNPADWWTMRLTKDSQGRYLLGDPGMAVVPMLFGVPVVQSIAVTADTFQLGAYNQAATKHDRESVVIDMSDSDGDNFVKQLVTLRATRRLALAVERIAALRGGDLTPA